MPETWNEISTLLLSLYRASRELPLENFQDVVLTLLRPLLPFDSSMWGSGILTSSGVAVHLHREPDEMLSAYEIKYQDTAVEKSRAHGDGTLAYNSAAMFPGKDKAGVRDYTRRSGHENCIVSAIADEANFTHWVSLYRANAGDPYTEAERVLVEILVPHLIEALAINRITHLDHLKGGDPAKSFQLAIADRQGVLYHAEAEFMALLREELPHMSARSLPTSFVRGLLESGRFSGRTTIVQVTRATDLLFLKARPRVAVDGLSTRELEIAREVARGEGYKQIARTLCIAPSTVRNHIQRIHKKLDTHSKAGLIAQIDLVH